MKTFNYRLFKEQEFIPTGDNTFEYTLAYTIRTVFYDEKGVPIMYSEEPASPIGNTITELKENLAQMKQAFSKATLTEEDFI